MTIATPTTDSVLRQLRQLSPREQLRVLSRILPDLARDLPPAPADHFRDGSSIAELIAQQKIAPLDTLDGLAGWWPKEESADEFVGVIRDWRQQNLVDDGDL